MPSSPAICTGPSRRRHRAFTIRFTVASGVFVGIERGRLDRSAIPAGPSARNRAAHFRAVGGEIMNIFAATTTGQCSSTMSLASRKRARGVRAALAWDTKASCVCVSGSLNSSTLATGGLHLSANHAELTQQRPWTSQLVAEAAASGCRTVKFRPQSVGDARRTRNPCYQRGIQSCTACNHASRALCSHHSPDRLG